MPDSVQRRDTIDIQHEPRLQRLFWNIERAGWVVMLVLLLLALLGFFGQRGILSSATAQSPDGSLTVDYNRFLHEQSPSDLTISLSVPSGAESVALRMNSEYVRSIPVRHFHPRPTEERALSGYLLYIFAVDPAEQHVIISAEIYPAKIGAARAEVGMIGGSSLSYSQFVYP